MKTVVATVLHPISAPFWNDFIAAVESQTDKDFELLIVQDGVPAPENPSSLRVRSLDVTGRSISQIRKALLRECSLMGAQWVILADSDDKMHKARVEKSKRGLQEGAAIVFNDLIQFPLNGAAKLWLHDRIKSPFVSLEDIKEGNCLGFSNSAFCLKKMPEIVFDIGDDIKAFDWAFFTRFLYYEKQAQFISDGLTFYRVHGENMALFKLERAKIEAALAIKRRHYSDLVGLIPWAAEKLKEYDLLQSWLRGDPGHWAEYINKLSASDQANYIWWEAVHP